MKGIKRYKYPAIKINVTGICRIVLQFMGLQRVGHNFMTAQQLCVHNNSVLLLDIVLSDL